MAEKNIVLNLETKATDGNPVFTPRQWLKIQTIHKTGTYI